HRLGGLEARRRAAARLGDLDVPLVRLEDTAPDPIVRQVLGEEAEELADAVRLDVAHASEGRGGAVDGLPGELALGTRQVEALAAARRQAIARSEARREVRVHGDDMVAVHQPLHAGAALVQGGWSRHAAQVLPGSGS